MPAWNNFKKKYCLEPEDLPIPHGPNVVVIESLDSEEFLDQETQQMQVRHNLWFCGFNVPLRINNTRVDVLRQLFGERTEDAIGKKAVLMVAMLSAYGKTKAAINIHPFPIDQDTPPTAVPARIASRSPLRLQAAAVAGVTVEAPPAAVFRSIAPPPGVTAPPSVQASGQKLGPEAAAELVLLLRERGKTWAWLVHHFASTGMGQLVPPDVEPPACDQALRMPAWRVLKDFPTTVNIPDREAQKAKLISSWVPPPAVQAHTKREVLDTTTGEVKPFDAMNPDDIPF